MTAVIVGAAKPPPVEAQGLSWSRPAGTMDHHIGRAGYNIAKGAGPSGNHKFFVLKRKAFLL